MQNLDNVYLSDKFERLRKKVSEVDDQKTFEDVFSPKIFRDFPYDEDVPNKYHRPLFIGTRDAFLNYTITLGELRKIVRDTPEELVSIPQIGSERAKFLINLFR